MMEPTPLEGVYERADVRNALAAGEWSVTLRAILGTGITRSQVANRTSISQAQVSRLARGQSRDPGIKTVRALCDGLGIPRRLAGLADDDGTEDNTDRRRFLVGALGVTSAVALPPHGQRGDEQLLMLTTLSYRRLEQHTRSRAMVAPVTAHLSLAHQLARDSEGGHRRRIFGAISEIAGLAAWLHADLSEGSQARRYYRMAIAAASRSGHSLLPIYMQGSLGQYASVAGDPAQGVRLIRGAAGRLPRSAPRIAWAWLCALEGVALVHLQDRAALAILDQAERHADAAQDDEPVWPWVFHFDDRKIAAHRAIAATRLRMPDLAITYSNKAGPSRSPKQEAVALAERAQALATKGETEQACKLVSDAYDIGRRFGSERVRQAVRDLRTELRPAPDRVTADLDERLHSSYLEDDG
jgi:transcriptional regulator with XRE-family HTH domain